LLAPEGIDQAGVLAGTEVAYIQQRPYNGVSSRSVLSADLRARLVVEFPLEYVFHSHPIPGAVIGVTLGVGQLAPFDSGMSCQRCPQAEACQKDEHGPQPGPRELSSPRTPEDGVARRGCA